jgi:fructokinase
MVVVCGEALIDLVPAGSSGPPGPAGSSAPGDLWRAVPGGGAANTAVALARLGTPVQLACRLSRDGFGRRIRRHLADNGVDLGLAVDAAEPTTLAVVGLDESGAADYQFYVENTADWQWTPEELPATLPPGTRALHLGTLASVVPPGAAVLLAWAARHRDEATVVYDVNVRPALLPDREAYAAQVEAWLEVAHVVKASEDDLTWLCPGREPLDVARAWLAKHGLDLVLVTRGASGAVAVTGEGPALEAPGFAVRVVDTVGAGDTFTGAFLHALSTAILSAGSPSAADSSAGDSSAGSASGRLAVPGRDALAGALRYAVAAAALTCTREGAAPPSRAEVDAFLRATG